MLRFENVANPEALVSVGAAPERTPRPPCAVSAMVTPFTGLPPLSVTFTTTGAITAPGVVDARRCLAWLLQADGPFPIEFRAALGDRIYGCDECQEVCPPNRRAPLRVDPSASTPWAPVVDLLDPDDAVRARRMDERVVVQRDPHM